MFVLFPLCLSQPALAKTVRRSAASLSAADNSIWKLKKILVKGNSKAKTRVILQELNFPKSMRVNQKRIDIGISNLRNTNLFATVESELSPDKKTLTVMVAERWTTIPILKVASGGNISEITAGIFDPNLFGEFLEAGAQYQRIGDANSGVVWFKNPRLFGKRQGIDIQLWKTNRLRTKYDQASEAPVITNGFLQKRDRIYLGFDKEFNPYSRGTLSYEYHRDDFTSDFVSDEVRAILATQGLPSETEVHFAGLSYEWGRLDTDEFLVDGTLLRSNLRVGFSPRENLDNFWNLDLNFQYFKTFMGRWTFAQRLLAGYTSTEAIQYLYYLGGLDRIRGIADNRFSGSCFWLSNSELRIPLFEHPWVVLQAIGFLDLATTGVSFSELTTFGAASTGGGIRLFLPKLYRFVIRLDYAVPLVKQDDFSLSFGIQQFF